MPTWKGLLVLLSKVGLTNPWVFNCAHAPRRVTYFKDKRKMVQYISHMILQLAHHHTTHRPLYALKGMTNDMEQ